MKSTVLNWLSTKKRQILLKKFRSKFASCGEGLLVYGHPVIHFPKRIKIGNNVSLNDGCVLNATSSKIEIGDMCTISSGAQVLAATYDVNDFLLSQRKTHISKPIIIGDNVWICAGAIICPGVRIMGRVIVAAGAVVTKDVLENNVIVAGNPAKVVKRITTK